MRKYDAASCHLIGATAAALLFLNLPTPASATTPAPPPAATEARPLSQTPASPGALPASEPSAAPATAAQPSSGPAASETAASAAPEKPKPLPTTLVARINLSTQTMVVQANGKTLHTWKVSTGAPGYATPPGTFKPGWMAQMWRSRQYDDAPMPYSVFFNGGIAVHGTMNPGSLGRAASHGCVRLATSNAAVFYKLVTRHGMAQTRIIVHGNQPFSKNQMVASRGGNRPSHAANPRAANQWVYQGGNTAYRGASPYGWAPPRADNSGYRQRQPAQPRRVSAVRTTSTYWSR